MATAHRIQPAVRLRQGSGPLFLRSQRVSRLTEGVEIIRRLWTEDRVTHHGRHWQLDDVSIRPRPLQQPRPPILVGSQVIAGIARAARIADGWLVVPVPTVDEFAEQAAGFARHGLTPAFAALE